MAKDLCFDPTAYTTKHCTLAGSTVRYRAFENIVYCAAPVDPIQKLNLYVPEDYYNGARHNGYTLHTAPIFVPNTVGGYLPGPAGPVRDLIALVVPMQRFVRWNMDISLFASVYADALLDIKTQSFLRVPKRLQNNRRPVTALAKPLRSLWT